MIRVIKSPVKESFFIERCETGNWSGMGVKTFELPVDELPEFLGAIYPLYKDFLNQVDATRPIGKMGNWFYISMDAFILLNSEENTPKQNDALLHLVSFNGTAKDIGVIMNLCKDRNMEGMSAMIDMTIKGKI